MYTKFSSLCLFSLTVLALCLGTLAQSESCATQNGWTNSTSTSSFSELDINYPTTLNIQVQYYPSTTGNIEVDIKFCSDQVGDTTWTSVAPTLSSGTNSIVLAVQDTLGGNGATTGSVKPPATSAAHRAAPLTLLILLFAAFLLPKNRLSFFALLCVLFAIYSPLTTAQSGAKITIMVGVPSQITTVCENGNCSPYPPTSSDPTSAPTPDPTPSPTPTPLPPVDPANHWFNLRMLIMAAKPLANYKTSGSVPSPMGADFVALAFSSMGTPYDFLVVTSTVDLSTTLSTANVVGLYGGIVVIGNTLLSSPQESAVAAYQKFYGVKRVVIGSTGASLPGITMGAKLTKVPFQLTLATEFAEFASCLNPAISVANNYTVNWSGYSTTPASLYPGTITDPTLATPFINAQLSTGPAVAAAAFVMPDTTQQLHYFVDNNADYIHSMAFAPALLNWLAPGGLFIGARRLTLSVQPDDLFLGSYIWDITTHTNPVAADSPWYRMSDYDLQLLADFFDGLNARLPAGSYLTVEWPTNFGGINDYYTNYGAEPDLLWQKALELQDKFYYLSHTWDHPCTFDTLNETAAYTTMFSEVSKNIDYLSTFFANNGMSRWSNFSMITPCVTGLYNAGALEAMAANGITACVSDESVTTTTTVDYEPITAYHGVVSTVVPNGYAGIYFVPREALDIDYCDITPEMVVDEYNTDNKPKNGAAGLTFEQIMVIQKMYGIEDKIAFRHDPFMLHQTNAGAFFFTDALTGTSYNTSLVALWIQRVVDEMMSYYNLPIYTPQMDNIVKMFQQRDAMDACGIVTTLGVNDQGQIVEITTAGTANCEMSLSGGAVLPGARMETYGPETTAWIELTANIPQIFHPTVPIPL